MRRKELAIMTGYFVIILGCLVYLLHGQSFESQLLILLAFSIGLRGFR